ncbi:cyclophilin-like domain-containing protein [Pilobolus umbonatus]|nr:cyclophilin-like domain-containing protein [Pilobolus umbonatus]
MRRSVYLDIRLGDVDTYNRRREQYTCANQWFTQSYASYGFTTNKMDRLSDQELETLQLILLNNPVAQAEEWSVEAPYPLKGGLVVIELFDEECPKTCENFYNLCEGGKVGKSSKKPLYYKNTAMFRLVPHFMIQGGDVTRDNGSGGDSIYNGKFKDEKPGLNRKFDECGLVAMANSGNDEVSNHVIR